jgi:hypothetical protein
MEVPVCRPLVRGGLRKRSGAYDQCRDLDKSRLRSENRDVAEVADRTMIFRLRLVLEVNRSGDDEREGDENAHCSDSTPAGFDHTHSFVSE